MKKCPFCAEEIQDEAIKCKHCFEFLDASKRPPPPALPMSWPPAQPGVAEKPLPWYFSTSFIVLTFLTLPPCVLPSVWLHPKMHLVFKLLITVAVAGFCWATIYAIKGLIQYLDEATKMFNEMK